MTPQQINQIYRTGQVIPKQKPDSSKPADDRGFQELLKAEQHKQSVKLSAHAQKRIGQGNIEFSPSQQHRIEEAVSKMEEKGADKSLVLMDGVAFVVSVKNRTIITAVDGDRTKEGVFTNIDSAIII